MADAHTPTRSTTRGALLSAAQALRLVWRTNRGLTLLLVLGTVVTGTAPAGAAYLARYVIDAVIAAAKGDRGSRDWALTAIAIEAVLVGAILVSSRIVLFAEQLLRALLAQRVMKLILGKASELGLEDFEDPALHDRLEEARRDAPIRPLSLVMRTFTLARFGIALIGYSAILVNLSWWAVGVLIVAGVPAFISEARFSRLTFRFFQKHSPENRERRYIETLMTREEFAKELGFFGLGRILLKRYETMFENLYRTDRGIAVRRHAWGMLLGLIGTGAFFAAYVWIAVETIEGHLTLGQMTMYLVVFRQGQTAVANGLAALGGIYEDALYLENLQAFLAHPVRGMSGTETAGPDPSDGLRVEGLCWTYPGAAEPALNNVSFHLPPGGTIAVVGHNGSGKSTLVKLLTRRYHANEGRILLDGLSLDEWDDEALRARVSVLFQDFNRYKLTVGENIGAGDREHFDDEARWQAAAERGLALDLIAGLPQGLQTRLGRAFRGAQELSGGQWQRVAFARSLMREESHLIVFDEPTSAADPLRQAEIDARLEEILQGRMGLIVSHRLATARIADHILVLDHGRVVEQGHHGELVAEQGVYADLFQAQASAYQ
ncbi:MAG: ABC transporter ATP-binding protein [Sandaracinaceae bacterium]